MRHNGTWQILFIHTMPWKSFRCVKDLFPQMVTGSWGHQPPSSKDWSIDELVAGWIIRRKGLTWEFWLLEACLWRICIDSLSPTFLFPEHHEVSSLPTPFSSNMFLPCLNTMEPNNHNLKLGAKGNLSCLK